MMVMKNGESIIFGDFNCLPVIIFHYGMLLAAVEWLVCMKNYAYPSLPQLDQTQ